MWGAQGKTFIRIISETQRISFTKESKILKKREIEQLYTKIVTALFFDVKYIDDNLDVQSVFETMNNRGKPLTTLEKLKNRLLFLTSKLPSSDDIQGLSDIINDSWGKVYEWLGTNVDSMLNEDEFLSAHLTLLRIPRIMCILSRWPSKRSLGCFVADRLSTTAATLAVSKIMLRKNLLSTT